LLPPTGCRDELVTQDLAHPSDIMLEKVLMQGVRNLQPSDEHKCKDILTAMGDFEKLALKEVDV